MKITRKKTGDRAYNLVDPQGRVIASAAQTGEHGRDNYPWDWYLATGVDWTDPMADRGPHQMPARTGGTAESLKVIVQTIESGADQYGLTFKEPGA